ncbi:hypothetical protein [Clostridium perfringens]|uniref:hypothetical protein n=1 Tax=Clostridium perfringens TaxID=1502 RepID=UPI0023419E92|nr:hypothetical protein [Clostridium perfringens]MDC4245678.1 hypothetical protein [Clostridium perfringens]
MENRTAMNKVELVGVVKEHQLKEGKGENGKYINGSLVVACGEAEVKLKVFVSEKTKEGKVKKSYETLNKFITEDYLTMAKNKDEAAVVRVYGSGDFTPQFREELFVPENGKECKSVISVDLGFGNIYVDENGKIKEEDYKATFDIEMYVQEVEEEVKKNGEDEEETGRVKIKGCVPCYGGKAFPITLIAGTVIDDEGEFDFAEQIRENVSEGDSMNFWGDINYISILEKKKKGGSLGRAKVEEKRTTIHELIATGGEMLDEEKEWEEETIEKALKERAIDIKEKEDKAKQENSKGTGLRSNKDKSDKPARPRPKF